MTLRNLYITCERGVDFEIKVLQSPTRRQEPKSNSISCYIGVPGCVFHKSALVISHCPRKKQQKEGKYRSLATIERDNTDVIHFIWALNVSSARNWEFSALSLSMSTEWRKTEHQVREWEIRKGNMGLYGCIKLVRYLWFSAERVPIPKRMMNGTVVERSTTQYRILWSRRVFLWTIRGLNCK